MKQRLTLAIAAATLALSACATAEGYRQHMSLLQGAPTDAILLDWGPPQNRTPMSNGNELWSYTKTTVDEQRRLLARRDARSEAPRHRQGRQASASETITETFPVWQPPQVYRSTCTTRFVMSAGRVADVSFDGEGCVAEELQ